MRSRLILLLQLSLCPSPARVMVPGVARLPRQGVAKHRASIIRLTGDATAAKGFEGGTPPTVAEMLEVTFVRACMDVAKGYVDTLKLFIAAAKGGYVGGTTIPALELELSMVETQTAGRPLMEEEVELRRLWICLVYLTLQEVGIKGADEANVGSTVPQDLKDKFGVFVGNVVAAKNGGATLKQLCWDSSSRATRPWPLAPGIRGTIAVPHASRATPPWQVAQAGRAFCLERCRVAHAYRDGRSEPVDAPLLHDARCKPRARLNRSLAAGTRAACEVTHVSVARRQALDEERLATGEDDTYYAGKDDEPGPFIPGGK